jgi:hypothetical protein
MTTPVLFRATKSGQFKGDVTAVFPTLPGSNRPSSMTCYAHVGQHSACDKEWYRTTRPATPEEYRSLHKELIGQGYDDLKIVSRITYAMDKERYAELNR